MRRFTSVTGGLTAWPCSWQDATGHQHLPGFNTIAWLSQVMNLLAVNQLDMRRNGGRSYLWIVQYYKYMQNYAHTGCYMLLPPSLSNVTMVNQSLITQVNT